MDLGFGDLGWDLMAEVTTLKIDQDVTDFHFVSLDDRESLTKQVFGELAFDQAERGNHGGSW
jgi:hypothetical protein